MLQNGCIPKDLRLAQYRRWRSAPVGSLPWGEAP